MKKNRRKLLKGLAIGSAWSAPVVSSVMLPVHAQTSNSGDIAQDGVIIASSLLANNPDDPQRALTIFNSLGELISDADGCCDGNVVTQTPALPAGTYRVAICSDGPQAMNVIVTTEAGSIAIDTNTFTQNTCPGVVVATVTLPGGTIVAGDATEDCSNCDD